MRPYLAGEQCFVERPCHLLEKRLYIALGNYPNYEMAQIYTTLLLVMTNSRNRPNIHGPLSHRA